MPLESHSKIKNQPLHPAWWKEAVIYCVFTPSFMDGDQDGFGDIAGVLQRLPYLQKLGINALWLCHVLPHGSGAKQWVMYENDENTIAENFEKLIEEAHQRNIKIIMELDISATSDEHPWFLNCEKRENYYILGNISPSSSKKNNNLTHYFAEENDKLLNWDSPALREEITKILQFWAKKGVDGFYLFQNKALTATVSQKHVKELRKALPKGVFLAGQTCEAVAERAQNPGKEDGQEFDFVLDMRHIAPQEKSLKTNAPQVNLLKLKKYYIKCMREFANENWLPLFLETSHLSRIVSRVGASPIYRSYVAKMLGTMLFTLRGTALIFQGQELGLPNASLIAQEDVKLPNPQICEKQAPAIAFKKMLENAASQACTPMPWGNGYGGGFTGAQPWRNLHDNVQILNATAQIADKNSVWNFYQSLIKLRKECLCLVYGSFSPVFVNNAKVFCYFRILDGIKYYVEINLSERQVPRPARILCTQKLELSNYDEPYKFLRAYEANIYRCF